MKSEVFTFIDIIGTAAFSISGVYAAMEKKLDIFGIFIIAFITAIGGGTIRDVLIGDLPVNWIRTNNYSIVIFLSAAAALLFHKLIFNYTKVLMFFDALGLGFFTVVGIHKGIEFGFSPGLCIALGTITACFGGLIRDISLSQIPQIFHKEVYATACIFGGILYFLLLKTALPAEVLDMICISVIVIIRFVAVKYNLSLPVIYRTTK
ncbi:MAG TPA: trimeric intracellular cation channel family protein [Chitinophagaceae bacterium]|nr:trimeric intracellular cation channel family protein [Chitinophagaceae bacterium]